MAKKEIVLNETEILLLKLLKNGIYARHAGKNLGLNEYQTYKTTKSIKTKLNARNLANATYIAFNKGFIK